MATIKRLDTADPAFDAALSSLLAWDDARSEDVLGVVRAVVRDVRLRGDAALVEYTNRFDFAHRLQQPHHGCRLYHCFGHVLERRKRHCGDAICDCWPRSLLGAGHCLGVIFVHGGSCQRRVHCLDE